MFKHANSKDLATFLLESYLIQKLGGPKVGFGGSLFFCALVIVAVGFVLLSVFLPLSSADDARRFLLPLLQMYGGMRMDTKNITEIHKNFPITRRGGDRWLYHMRNTIDNDIQFGERHDEVKALLMQWLDVFAKSVINLTGASADEYHQSHGPAPASMCPFHRQQQQQQQQQEQQQESTDETDLFSASAPSHVLAIQSQLRVCRV